MTPLTHAFTGALLLAAGLCAQPVRFLGKTRYLDNARAVVTHNIDDSTKYVPSAIDAMDKYGIKSTIFIITDEDPAPEERFLTQLVAKDLWPRLRQAVDDGHEIGSHSQTHPCRRAESDAACGRPTPTPRSWARAKKFSSAPSNRTSGRGATPAAPAPTWSRSRERSPRRDISWRATIPTSATTGTSSRIFRPGTPIG